MDAPLTRADPLLAEVVAEPTHYPGSVGREWKYAPWDKSFRPGDPEGGFNRYGWNGSDQAALDSIWRPEADAIADDLIDQYAALWPWFMPRVLRARLPEMVKDIDQLVVERKIGGWQSVRSDGYIVAESALMYGVFDHVRAQRTWGPAPEFWCRICWTRQQGSHLKPWMLETCGPWRYCEGCCIRARTGRGTSKKSDIFAGLRRQAEALESIPSERVHYESVAGLEVERRDQVMVGLIVGPDPKMARNAIGGKWLDVLRASGLVGDAWRPSRGTYCTAADGHRCRSLAERIVDDWLARRGIEHEPEPKYPGSSRRADWLLSDGTLVEYAGLLADGKYAAKMAEKRRIADEAGIRLVVLVPEDLHALERRLGEWLGP